MVKITNGVNVYEVTRGAFDGIFSRQGYTIVDEAAEKKVFTGKVAISYTANPDVIISEDNYPTVAVALKGDTDLNGKVELSDAYDVMMYNSYVMIDMYKPFTEVAEGELVDPLMEKLVYYVSDVDTESKAGIDTDDAEITLNTDAYKIMMKNSYDMIDMPKTWEELLGK